MTMLDKPPPRPDVPVEVLRGICWLGSVTYQNSVALVKSAPLAKAIRAEEIPAIVWFSTSVLDALSHEAFEVKSTQSSYKDGSYSNIVDLEEETIWSWEDHPNSDEDNDDCRAYIKLDYKGRRYVWIIGEDPHNGFDISIDSWRGRWPD